ncbi:hypothetical protein [Paenibacillus sp. y28]|uniref:hypothetical protein n=1 Tax=Paenibacillus sp. y28 TaxID=3129110 RepID=UPI0030160ECE
MKVLVIGATSRIVPMLQEITGITDAHYVRECRSDEELPAVDIMLLDGLSFPEVEAVLQRRSSADLVYVYNARKGIIAEHHKQVQDVCLHHQMAMLTDVSDQHLSADLERRLFPERFKDIKRPSVALISCHRRSGRQTISGSLAKALVEQTGCRIGLVDLNPYAYEDKGPSIWQCMQEYEAGLLTPLRVREISEEISSGVYRIGGNAKLDHARRYDPVKLEQVLRIVEQAFDFTVLAISPYWDNTLTLIPARMTSQKLLIASSQSDGMSEFYAVLPQVAFLTQSQLDLRSTPFIYNMDGHGLVSRLSISTKLDAASVLTIPYDTKLAAGDQLLQESMQKLAARLAEQGGLPLRQTVTVKRTWWRGGRTRV